MKTATTKAEQADKIKINPQLDYAELPKAFKEKAERAKIFLKKHPIPEQLIKRS